MGIQRHVGGNLKQTNKKHKGQRKRTLSANLAAKSSTSHKTISKKARRQCAKQQRLIKNTPVASAQKSSDCPILCLLLPLHEDVDLSMAQIILSKGDAKSSSHSLPINQGSKESTIVNYLRCPSLKKEFAFVNGKCSDLLGNLDLARLSDWIIFLLPGDISKLDQEKYSDMMAALYSQGLPSSVFAVMSNLADKKGFLSMLEVKFPVSDGKIRSLNSSKDATTLLRYLSQSQKNPTLSSAYAYMPTSGALMVGTTANRLRSGVLIETVETQPNTDNDGEVFLKVEGLLRGWGLPLFDPAATATTPADNEQRRVGRPFMHLTGWGDFPLQAAQWYDYKQAKLETNPSRSMQEWVSDGQEADAMTPGAVLTDIWDDALQLDEEAEESDEEEGNMCVDDSCDEAEDNIELSSDECDDADLDSVAVEHTEGAGVSFKMNPIKIHKIPAPSTRAEMVKAAQMEHEFPDEVETPQGISARDRFAKYRGLPSFSKCTWPTENDTSLPYEYSRIFRFGNYAHNRRTLMKNTLRQLRQLASEVTGSTNPCEQSSCPQYIPPNSIVRLTLGPIQRSLADAIVSHGTTASLTQTPLTLWSLLPYERCMSVLHMTLQKRRLQEEGTWVQQQQSSSNMVDPDPIMAKEPMLFQVGIRRFTAAPIYSQANKASNTNAKVERFFTLASSPIVATVYAPVVYAPQAVLQFRIQPHEDPTKIAVTDFVATGSVLSVDPTRAIVKRILLSGHPFKINKRSAVVRYMFHSPDDIEYFKPIQLYTKSGAVGHIKQSVGTHGLMKCLFDRQLNASDVIMMPLYKRVFPKMTYDPRTSQRIEWVKSGARTSIMETFSQSSYVKPTQSILKKTSSAKHNRLFSIKDEPMQKAVLTPDEEALFV